MFRAKLVHILVILVLELAHIEAEYIRNPTKEKHHKLLLISVDGFSAEYIKEAEKLKAFRFMKENGSKAQYMKPPFPTLTNPSHITLASGLWVESHGVVHNSYFNHKTQSTSHEDYLSTEAINEWWDMGYSPIWITATEQGLKSGCYMFPGCNATISGRSATKSVLQTIAERTHEEGFWSEKVDTAVSWLAEDDFDFVAIYFQTLDLIGHFDGKREVSSFLPKLDDLLLNLFDRLNKTNKMKDTNIILTSDHGMFPVDWTVPVDEVISLSKYIADDVMVDFKFADGHAVAFVEPANGYKQIVYELLKEDRNMEVYLKEEIPERWHYMNHERIPSILMVAHPGYQIHEEFIKHTLTGDHGYDNELHEMKTLFYAVGPSFREGYVSEPFDSIHVYSLMCRLLGLQPAPNNGSLNVLSPMLKAFQFHPDL